MKPDRHSMIKVNCEWCGKPFMARAERVARGQGKWCSLSHYREWMKSRGSQRKNIGKENAIIQWEESKKMYCAYWYDGEMKYHSSGWARWYWELNVGEVPSGYRASYKDGDSKNTSPNNVCLKTMAEISDIGERTRGVPKSKNTRKKLSIAHTGKKLSKEHKDRIADSNRKKWASGLFDFVHKGKYNSHWRGGVSKLYPKEFYEINPFIRERDKCMCQICGRQNLTSRTGQVHHINGNRSENTGDNLILVCVPCHGKIHAQNDAPPPILAFRSKLEWNKA